MSTNKTQNYNLHSWIPQDDFHVSEINENFTRLDEATGDKVGMITGQYNGACRVELGVKPLAVIVCCILGLSAGYIYTGIAAQDMPVGKALILDESGFTAGDDSSIWARLGTNTYCYHYVAFY